MKKAGRVLFGVIGSLLAVWLWVYLWGPRCAAPEVVREEWCRHGTIPVRLAVAMQKYCQVYGKPPPPVFLGPNGHEHSWRVLLLPYLPLGEDAYRDYRSDEPWDSAHNRRALRSFLRHGFHYCPQDRVASSDSCHEFTSYLMVVRGESGLLDRERQAAPEEVLVVESAECGIRFAEPRDILWERLWRGDSPWAVGKLYSRHDYCWALRRNGQLLVIPRNMSPGQLRLLLEGYPVGNGGRTAGGASAP